MLSPGALLTWALVLGSFSSCAHPVVRSGSHDRSHPSAKFSVQDPSSYEEFLRQRVALSIEDSARSTDYYGEYLLNSREQVLSKRLRALINADLDSLETANIYPLSQHFFRTKNQVAALKSFRLLQMMPKGGILHAHIDALGNFENMYQTASQDPNCFIRIPSPNTGASPTALEFRFFSPSSQPSEADGWLPLMKFRSIAGETGDNLIMKSLTLLTEDPDQAYPTENLAWNKFRETFGVITGLYYHLPTFSRHLRESLIELRSFGISHIELRYTLGIAPVYSDRETLDDPRAAALDAIRNAAKAANMTVAVIWCSVKEVLLETGVQELENEVRMAENLAKRYPDLLKGFDVVGQEHTLSLFDLSKVLLDARRKVDAKLPLVLHAGETSTITSVADTNLVDAFVLETKRIGHGLALANHERLVDLAIQNDVAIEVCPVSNQVLKLVPDFRNHPLISLLARGVPVALSFDDPALFGYRDLTYDFWLIAAAARLGLKGLKQLAFNSIKFSLLENKTKTNALIEWHAEWDKWVESATKELTRH